MKLLLTSAWNPAGTHSPADLRARRDRLLRSIEHYLGTPQIDRIILLDATMSPDDAASLSHVSPTKMVLLNPSVQPTGTFNGPSYLEALLYLAAATRLRDLILPSELCMKVSGGYVVKNIDRLCDAIQRQRLGAVGFIHQNPLRLQPRFAMTSCMVMQGSYWQNFIAGLRTQLEDSRTKPLESLYCNHLKSIGAIRGPSLPYPRLDAYFSTGKMHSSSIKYQMREALWRAYAQLGLFVLSTRCDE